MKLFHCLAVALLAVASGGVTAQSSQNSQEVTASTPQTFMVLPTPEPTRFDMRNVSPLIIPFAGLLASGISYIHNKTNTDAAAERLSFEGFGGVAVQEAKRQLLAQGFQEVDNVGLKIDLNDPGAFDYQEIKQDVDVIVHMYFEKIGLYSSLTSSAYEPYANLRYCLVTRKSKPDCATDSRASYGYNLKQDYPEDLMYNTIGRWQNLDDVKNRSDELLESYRYGIKRMASGIASEAIKIAAKSKQVAPDVAIKKNSPPEKALAAAVQPEANDTIPQPQPHAPVQATEESKKPIVIAAETIRVDSGKTQASIDKPDLAGSLRTLEKIFKEGLITQQEYETKKKEILQRL